MAEDNSTKYRLDVPVSSRDGMPEGLGRVLDILQQNIKPRQRPETVPPATDNTSSVSPEPD